MTSHQLDCAVGHYFDYDLNLNKIPSRKNVLRRILCLKQSKKVFVFRIISGKLSEIYIKTGLNIIGRKGMEDKLKKLYSEYRIASRRRNTPQCNDFIVIKVINQKKSIGCIAGPSTKIYPYTPQRFKNIKVINETQIERESGVYDKITCQGILDDVFGYCGISTSSIWRNKRNLFERHFNQLKNYISTKKLSLHFDGRRCKDWSNNIIEELVVCVQYEENPGVAI
ncbi:hypothetical protein A3Q56_08283, partial [Intoshia linei]